MLGHEHASKQLARSRQVVYVGSSVAVKNFQIRKACIRKILKKKLCGREYYTSNQGKGGEDEMVLL